MQQYNPAGRDHRREPRIKIFQPAELEQEGGESARVHLLNISSGGALVYGEPPRVGDAVRLACGVVLGEARVAWRTGRRFGVAFVRPLGQAKLAEVLQLQAAMIRTVSERMAVV